MKFEKPKSTEISAGVTHVAGATLGFLAPNGLANAYAKVDDEASITDEQKTKKMYVNAVCLVGGIALALMVKGSDMGATAVKGLGIGLAGGGAKGLITHFAKDKVTTTPGTTSGRFVAGSLGCACSSGYPALGKPRRRSLRIPYIDTTSSMENSSVLDLAV
ncbi:hypothetical protein [Flavobacterium sp.]|uniref:hypothetical protein n=1 Tax=Flavobacterium sp. TaxID=239 RepID=UPI004047DB43